MLLSFYTQKLLSFFKTAISELPSVPGIKLNVQDLLYYLLISLLGCFLVSVPLSKSPIFFDPDIYELNRQIIVYPGNWMISANALFQKEKNVWVSVSVLKSTWKVMARDLHSSVLCASWIRSLCYFSFFLFNQVSARWGVGVGQGRIRAVKPSSFFLSISALRRWGSWKVKVLVFVVYSGNDQPQIFFLPNPWCI